MVAEYCICSRIGCAPYWAQQREILFKSLLLKDLHTIVCKYHEDVFGNDWLHSGKEIQMISQCEDMKLKLLDIAMIGEFNDAFTWAYGI